MFLGEILCCGLHRISEILLTLGRGDKDWTAWYKFFQAGSFDEEKAGEKLLQKILEEEKGKNGPIVFLTDGVNIFRSTGTFPGVIVQRSPDTIRWKRGFRYAQRFLHTAYLSTEQDNGYCEAIPLRFIPAFGKNAKNLPEGLEPKTPHQASLECLHWLRSQVDRFGYSKRLILQVGGRRFRSKCNLGKSARESCLDGSNKEKSKFISPSRERGKLGSRQTECLW